MISPELNVVRQMSKLLLVIGFVLGFAFSAHRRKRSGAFMVE